MRRVALVLVLAALSLPLWSQEVAVFVDHRSLIVLSHRVDGDWTYFKIGNGEMAVPSNTVLKIAHEGVAMPSPQAFSPAVSPSPGQGGPGWRAEQPVSRPQMAPPQRPPAPAFDEPEPEDEPEADADEPDEEEKPEEKPPLAPQNPNMPNLPFRPGMPPTLAPGTMPTMPPGTHPGTTTTNTTKAPFTTTSEDP